MECLYLCWSCICLLIRLLGCFCYICRAFPAVTSFILSVLNIRCLIPRCAHFAISTLSIWTSIMQFQTWFLILWTTSLQSSLAEWAESAAESSCILLLYSYIHKPISDLVIESHWTLLLDCDYNGLLLNCNDVVLFIFIVDYQQKLSLCFFHFTCNVYSRPCWTTKGIFLRMLSPIPPLL